LLFIKYSLLKLFFVGTYIVTTHALYICGDTQENAVHHTGDFKGQAINILRPRGFYTYHPVKHSSNVVYAHFMMRVLYGSQNIQRLLLYTV